MMITKMALPRRTFLKGLGTAVALPLLDSMVPALTAQAATVANTPRRLGYVFIPMGMNPAPWTPKEMGALTSLSPSLAALTPHLDNVTVVTNMALENAHTTGNHASSNAAFLSCLKGDVFCLQCFSKNIECEIVGEAVVYTIGCCPLLRRFRN